MDAMPDRIVSINRAPVLTLWAAVVAERLGFDPAEALTLGKAVAGLNAYSKGVRLGIYQPTPASVREKRKSARAGEQLHVDLMQRAVAVVQTAEGLRALAKEKPVDPAGVERYLASKFGESLAPARQAMKHLAAALPPRDLALQAYGLYERFRPSIPAGERGWGAKGALDLALIERLAKEDP
jgi:hypothetical protein